MSGTRNVLAVYLALLAFFAGGCALLGLASALFERPNDLHVTISVTVFLFTICIAAGIGAYFLARSKAHKTSDLSGVDRKDHD